MEDFIKVCFVCGSLVDDTKFGATKRDGRHICSEECLAEYQDMSDVDFERCKREYYEGHQR